MSKSVCVCGGASFIGSHLVEQLVKDGNQVAVVDDLSSGYVQFLSNVKDRIVFHKFNIKNDPRYLEEIFRNCELVYQLANTHGGRNFIDFHPAQCCANMAIDNLVFETAVNTGVKHVQYISSACVYSPILQLKGEFQKLKEDSVDYSELETADGEYGLAKLMGEISAKSFRKEFGLNGSILRLSSIYGKRENKTHAVMALIAKAFVNQEPYEIFGDGTQIRNFTHVDDVVKCMIRASEKIQNFSPINVGTEETITINDLAEMIFEEFDWRPKKIFHDLEKPQGPHSRVVNNTKTTELLGFKKSEWTSIAEGIAKTIAWYKETHTKEIVENNLGILLTERWQQTNG